MVTQTRPENKARSFGQNIESDLASRSPSPMTMVPRMGIESMV
jgi:hypothetical protein